PRRSVGPGGILGGRHDGFGEAVPARRTPQERRQPELRPGRVHGPIQVRQVFLIDEPQIGPGEFTTDRATAARPALFSSCSSCASAAAVGLRPSTLANTLSTNTAGSG